MKNIDINRFFRFEMGFSKLQDSIEDSAYQHSAFWELLHSKKATLAKLYDEGSKILQHLDAVRDTYEHLVHINGSNIHCLVLYANFMKVIVNSADTYEKSQETI